MAKSPEERPAEAELTASSIRLRLPAGAAVLGVPFDESVRSLLADPLCDLGPAAAGTILRLCTQARNQAGQLELAREYRDRPQPVGSNKAPRPDWRQLADDAGIGPALRDSAMTGDADRVLHRDAPYSTEFRALIRSAGEPVEFAWLRVAVLHSLEYGRQRQTAGLHAGMAKLCKLLIAGPAFSGLLAVVASHYDRQLRAGTDPRSIPNPPEHGKLTRDELSAFNSALFAIRRREYHVRAPILDKLRWASDGLVSCPGLWAPVSPVALDHSPKLPAPDLYGEAVVYRRQPPEASPIAPADEISEALSFQEWLAERDCSLHLAGSLLPGTDRAFAAPEFAAIAAGLREIAADGEAAPLTRAAAASYLLCALTGHPRQAVVAGLAYRMRPPEDARPNHPNGWIEQMRFKAVVPGAEGFGAPDPSAASALLPTVQHVWLWLPAEVQAVLQALPRGEKVWHATEATWDRHFNLVKERLTPIAPRFSEARLRHTLPIAAWLHSQDICQAQILSSDLLEHSSALLHYRAYPPAELHKTFRGALGWMPDFLHIHPEPPPQDGTLVGAPCAAIDDAHIRTAVQEIADRYRRMTKWRTSSFRRELDAFNLCMAYTVALFAAATAHRLTFHIAQLTLGDLVFDVPAQSKSDRAFDQKGASKPSLIQLAVLHDKKIDNGLIYRAAAVPLVAKEQIDAALSCVLDMIDKVRHQPGGAKVAQQLHDILRGKAPLFQLLAFAPGPNPELHLRRAYRGSVQGLLPELRIPLEYLRHRFTSFAHRAGVGPTDILRQMGHALPFTAFGPTDPDSLLDYALRVAPCLDREFRREGWPVIGKRQRRANDPPDSSVSLADVWRLERATLDRARKLIRRSSYNRRHRSVVCALEVERRIHGTLAERLATRSIPYTHYATTENVALEQADVAWLEQQMEENFETLDELCLASRIMRRVLRRNVRQNGWICPSYPRLVFRKRVELPVITPAVPRAYAVAARLLDWVEREVDPVRLFDGQKPTLTAHALCLATCELAVRGGLVQEDRLLRCLRFFGQAAPFCERTDAVLIEYIANDRIAQDGDGDVGQQDDGEVIRESIVLHGATALLALAWKKSGLDTTGVDGESLNQALRQALPPGILGRIGPKQEPLPILLAAAGIARRMTQPGLRSAWEEGRLRSRTLNAERVRALQVNSAIPRQDPPPAGRHAAVQPIFPEPTAGTSADVAYLRWARRRLHQHIGKRRSRIASDKLAAVIEAELSHYPEHTATAVVVQQFIREDLALATKHSSIEVSTVYGHVVAILEPLIKNLKNRDILRLDSESLAALVIVAVKNKKPSNQQRTFWVLRRLLRIVEKKGGAAVDESEFDELDLGPAELGPPYIITTAEYHRAQEQLRLWAGLAKSIGAQNSAYHPAEYESALEILKCSFRFGLRTGETESRRRSDLLDAADSPVLLVRPHYRAPLKTPTSQRALVLARCTGPDELREFQDRVALLAQASGKSDPSLLSAPTGVSRLDRPVELARLSLARVADAQSARLYAGRKSLAGSAAAQVLAGDLPALAGLQRPAWLQDVMHLDGALQLTYTARLLGQGTPMTTLSYYVHLIGLLCNTDNGWPALSIRAAALLGLCRNDGNLRVRLFRLGRPAEASGSATAIERYVNALALSEPAPATAPPAGVPLNAQLPGNLAPAVRQPAISLETLGQIVRNLALGMRLDVVEARFGLQSHKISEIADELLAVEQQFRAYYVEFDAGSQIPRRGSVRTPAPEPAMGILRRCDALRADNPRRWNELLRVLRRQSRLDGSLYIRERDLAARIAATVGYLLGHPASFDIDAANDRCIVRGGKAMTLGGKKGIETAPFRFANVIAVLADRLDAGPE